MARKGWEQAIAKVERPDDWGVPVISSSEVRNLLARQHAAVVRLVNKQIRYYDANKDHENQMYPGALTDGAYVRLDDLLAALGKIKETK